MAAETRRGPRERRKHNVGIANRVKQKNATQGIVWRSGAIMLYPVADPAALSMRRRPYTAKSDQKRANAKPRTAEAAQGIRKARQAAGRFHLYFFASSKMTASGKYMMIRRA